MPTNDDAGAFDDFFRNARPAPEYQGMSADEAEELARRKGIALIRVIELDPGASVGIRLDLQPERLNLVVLDGVVTRAAFC